MWVVTVTTLALTGTVFCASIFQCPDGTTCDKEGFVESTSFQFLDKLMPKQYQIITKLIVSNASLDKVPAELKYLKKLEYLDLSNNNIQVSSIPSLPHLKYLKLSRNNIKGISLTLLPRNIEELDLSNNLLSQIPKDWTSLRALKSLHLDKNLIDCDCYNNNIFIYDKLIKKGISIPEPVTCYVPKHFAGKNINSINCTAEDQMINDQFEYGSGAGEDVFSEAPLVPYLAEGEEIEENELIDDKESLPQEQQFITAGDILTTIVPEEGSGALEGSGFMPVEFEHVAACLFDCATPEPVGVHDKNDTGPAPGPTDQIKIIAEDVFHPIFAEPSPPTTTTTTSTTTTTTETSSSFSTTASAVSEVTEEILKKEWHAVDNKGTEIDKDVEILLNETRTGEMEKTTALKQNNYAVYVVVVCGLLLAVIFLVYLIKKRKAKRLQNKNRRELNSGFEEEMKPLGKPSIQPVKEKNGKAPNDIPEHIPLFNGQNGKPRDEPVLKSFTPLEYPDSILDNQDGDVDEPIIREKPELLTPVTERVTIRASEIPESVPKTPVLVHRAKNSEGEIVTTVVPP